MNIDQNKIIEILEQKGANKPCHRCGHEQFSLMENYSIITLQKEIGGPISLGGITIPTVLTVCNNCGAITFHAIGALGLLKGGE